MVRELNVTFDENGEIISTSSHDKIVDWLMIPDNLFKIFPSFYHLDYYPQNKIPFITKEDSKFNTFNKSMVDEWIVKTECPLHNKGYIDSYIDLVYLKMNEEYNVCAIVIEVKPTIRNKGEVLRQLNKYKVRTNHNFVYCLCTYTTEYDVFFENEHIVMLHPPMEA